MRVIILNVKKNTTALRFWRPQLWKRWNVFLFRRNVYKVDCGRQCRRALICIMV